MKCLEALLRSALLLVIIGTSVSIVNTALADESTPHFYREIIPTINGWVLPSAYKPSSSLLDSTRQLLDFTVFSRRVAPADIVFDATRLSPRGQLVGRSIYLASSLTWSSEFLKVLTHESAHSIDLYSLKKGIFIDPSMIFYRISWSNETVKKRSARLADFVSWYAMSNRYEDFAESLTMFVFHNQEFAERSKGNEALRKKYEFFERFVFADREFVGTWFEQKSVPSYLWDTTKIAVNTKNFLKYIK